MTKNTYFSSFPTINYNNQNVVDITERAVFANTSLNNPNLFYPYDLSSDERAEQFSNRYYNDPYKDWVLYLGNQFVDPYYDWYLNDDSFQKYIVKKYGSEQLAQIKVAYFQNNWYNASNISVSEYNALPYTLYKYWEAIYGNNNKIVGYSRIKSNDQIVTNSIRSLIVTNNNFVRGELCILKYSSGAMSQAQVLSISNNTIYIQHVISTNDSTNNLANSTIIGIESNTYSSFSYYTKVSNALLPEEVSYWSPVTYFDMETSKNESNKTIQVLDSNYAITAANDLTNVLQNKKTVF